MSTAFYSLPEILLFFRNDVWVPDPFVGGVASRNGASASELRVNWSGPTGGVYPYVAELQIGPADDPTPSDGEWVSLGSTVPGLAAGVRVASGLLGETLYAFRVKYTDDDGSVTYSNVITDETTLGPDGVSRRRRRWR